MSPRAMSSEPTGATPEAAAGDAGPTRLNTKPLFKLMVEKKASDLFFTSYAPVKIKIEGQIFPVNKQILTPEIVKQAAYGLMTPEQIAYAASDVLNLHALKTRLDAMLVREGRMELAQACFDFLPWRAKLDLAGWEDADVFAHA